MRQQPIGYWVKLLDELIEARFEEVLAGENLTRRHWQCLNVVGPEGTSRAGLESALAPFVSAGVPAGDPSAGTDGRQAPAVGGAAGQVSEVLHALTDRGWMMDEGAVLCLTPEGERAHQRLQEAVGRLRRQVAQGVSEEQYAVTVQTLARMCENLRPDA